MNWLFRRDERMTEPVPNPGAREPGRKRVLVESRDLAERWAVETILRRDGFDVVSCGGPEQLPDGRCPLVSEARCPAVADADAVFYRLDLPDAANEAVLRSLKRESARRPVVVEVPGPRAERLAELLDGCRVLPMPATAADLVAALSLATGSVAAG